MDPPAPIPGQAPENKVKDAFGNLVTDKASNKPYLAYQQQKLALAEKAKAKAAKKKAREDKIARGEALGPEDALDSEPSTFRTVAQLLLVIVATFLVAGYFITGSWIWEYEGKWTDISSFLPDPHQRLFSESQLRQFIGEGESPIYVAIDGDVFDVSSNRRVYGPGGGYSWCAGADAARAYATGCFQTHRTHDLRGLTPAQLKSVAHWKKFFAEHAKYKKVGRVAHRQILDTDPIPPPCEGAQPDTAAAPAAGPNIGAEAKPKPKQEL